MRHLILCAGLLVFALSGADRQALASNPPDEVIVTFTRVSHNGNAQQPEIEVEWKPFKKLALGDAFDFYEQPLIYRLQVTSNGSTIVDSVLDSTAYSLRRVELGQPYDFTVRIASDHVIDITDELNQQLSGSEPGQYGYRQVSVSNKVQWMSLPMNLTNVEQAFGRMLESGRFLGISYILLGISVIGVLLSFAFAVKLFGFRRYRLYRMKRYWSKQKHKNIEELQQELESFEHDLKYRPTVRILKSGLKTFLPPIAHPTEDYNYRTLASTGEERHHWSKLRRMQKVLHEGVRHELLRLSNLDFRVIRPFYRHRLWNFFFSVEFFWNFGVVAPMLGLLGTVTGISHSFGLISNPIHFGAGNLMIGNLSTGINEALYTTIGGLLLGLPFLGVYYIFTWKINRIKQMWLEITDEFIKTLEK